MFIVLFDGGSCLITRSSLVRIAFLYRNAHDVFGNQRQGSSSLALLHFMRVVECLCECGEMYREANGHEHVEDLVLLAPRVEISRSPFFRYPCLCRGC